MVILSILVLCVASSTDASDQVLDLPEVVVQPSLIPGLLAFDRSPSLAQSHIQLDNEPGRNLVVRFEQSF